MIVSGAKGGKGRKSKGGLILISNRPMPLSAERKRRGLACITKEKGVGCPRGDTYACRG